jgi:polyhydroxyalkanoate synthesis regulator phasin
MRIAVAAVLVSVIGVAMFGVVAHAQTATPQSTTTTVSDYVQKMWDAVAAKLGVKRADLDKAVKDAGSEVADQAVKDGKITQAQADKLKSGLQAGPGLGMMRGWGERGFGMKGGCMGGQGNQDAIAKALGMTTAELTAALQSGKTLQDLATAKGTDVATIQKTIMKDQINQAVKDGKLTQAQADWMLQGIDQGYMPGGRGFGHRGGMMWGFGDNDNKVNPINPNNPSAPSQQPSPSTPSQQNNTTTPSNQGDV